MRKVAIVGVEGSGKTVMLAGLADLYSSPDNEGYYLAPKDFNTASYVAEVMGRLRNGIWPAATADDVFRGLKWMLRRRADTDGTPTDICELNCLDFPGEVYRKAFVDNSNAATGMTMADTGKQISEEMQGQIRSLKNYIKRADSLIVLVNLGDVVTHGLANRRVHESIWVTSAILEVALKERPRRVMPKTAIVLSQADIYEATIKDCGGAKGALEKYLPHVHNSYDWLDVFPAYTIDKTRLDDDGRVMPDPSFTTEGLRPIMNWLLMAERSQEVTKGEKCTSAGSSIAYKLWCWACEIGIISVVFYLSFLLSKNIFTEMRTTDEVRTAEHREKTLAVRRATNHCAPYSRRTNTMAEVNLQSDLHGQRGGVVPSDQETVAGAGRSPGHGQVENRRKLTKRPQKALLEVDITPGLGQPQLDTITYTPSLPPVADQQAEDIRTPSEVDILVGSGCVQDLSVGSHGDAPPLVGVVDSLVAGMIGVVDGLVAGVSNALVEGCNGMKNEKEP